MYFLIFLIFLKSFINVVNEYDLVQFQLEIDGRVYDNVNHFYQLAKTEALCGVTSLLMVEGSEGDGRGRAKDYNTLAKNILRINKVHDYILFN